MKEIVLVLALLIVIGGIGYALFRTIRHFDKGLQH